MYKRRAGQISMLESPEMFGGLPLDSKNEWVRLAKLVSWGAFEERYTENFKSQTGQLACTARMALGALLIKERNRFSDEDVVRHLAMNPYFQHFIGLTEYRYEAPFDASMLTRFRQRITPEMLIWVNDRIMGRPEEKETEEKNNHDDPPDGGNDEPKQSVKSEPPTESNQGTLMLDATCAPQTIRFPTDASLLNEARENAEEIIDLLHAAGLTEGKKPRTYREKARKAYNAFSKCRKKTKKAIRKAIRAQLQYLGRAHKRYRRRAFRLPERAAGEKAGAIGGHRGAAQAAAGDV